MGIPENQLETWTTLGSEAQSSQTYQTIKSALEAKDTAYNGKVTTTFLQGSYNNDTNIRADSDVDVVIECHSTFYYDISRLSADDKVKFESTLNDGKYSHSDFKRDVTAALEKRFGADVRPGKKAIWVKPNAGRRNADVLPAIEFRRYYRYTGADTDYDDGVCFWPEGGDRIENYPKLHAKALTNKHQNTSSRYKSTVRIWKNMRNRMIEDKKLTEGVALSHYLESLLFNVPNDKFVTSRVTTFENCIAWLAASKREDLICASNMFWLLRDNQPTSWSPQSCQTFLTAAQSYWNNWK